MTGLLLISTLVIAAVTAIPADFKNRIDLPISLNSPQESSVNKELNSDGKQNPWELSGLFEGDIMLPPGETELTKTGVTDKRLRWPGGVIPIKIGEDFDKDSIFILKTAIREFHNKTCLRFRPYHYPDKDYLSIQSANTGCWSSVGRIGGRQVLNLQDNAAGTCMIHSTVVHEMLHALGFHHQQSASDRDRYVRIHWENIEQGREYNFKSFNPSVITDFGVGYDYSSIMHYSRYAFSKNEKPTITPKKEINVELGTSKRMSEKDLIKLNRMYEKECGSRTPLEFAEENEKLLEDSVTWLQK